MLSIKRRIAIFFMVLLLIVVLIGCGSKVSSSKTTLSSSLMTTVSDNKTQMPSSSKTELSSSSKTTDLDKKTQMNGRIKTLIQNNIECEKMFFVGVLPDDGVLTSFGAYKVTSDKFRTFDDLKAFVTDTYEQQEADYLLYNYIGGKKPLYFEKNGVLYRDANGGGNLTPGIDWNDNYTFQYSDVSNIQKKITFSVTIYNDTNITSKNVEEIAMIVLEKGVWKLLVRIGDPY